MKATKQGKPYMSPTMRRMAEGGTAKAPRKVMKRNKDTGEMTELTGRDADAVRSSIKQGKTKDIKGGNKLTQMLGMASTYNVVGDGKAKAAPKPRVSTSGGATKTSKRPPAKPTTRGMSNTDQMRARQRGKTGTPSTNSANDPRNPTRPPAKKTPASKPVNTPMNETKRTSNKPTTRSMTNTDQMRARTRGKTDTSEPGREPDPRKTSGYKKSRFGLVNRLRGKSSLGLLQRLDKEAEVPQKWKK